MTSPTMTATAAAHRRAAAAATMLAAALGMAPAPSPAAPFEVPPGYARVWADEFDRDGLPDPRRWMFDTARNKIGWHNRELQYYADARGTNAEVRDGRLRITARREAPQDAPDWGGQVYTSARLLTRGLAAWTYGFFEVRAKMPCGKGTWPAIWTLGRGGLWPDDGELDIVEFQGSNPERTFSAVHTAAGHAERAVHGFARVADPCGSFHRYQMHWTAEGVTFGVDGFAHLHYPRLDAGRRGWPFDAPQYLILNVAIGGWLGGPVDDSIFPVSMEVDYVRVYQRPEAPPR